MDVKGAKALSERLAEAARDDDPYRSERPGRSEEQAAASSDATGRACRAVLTHLRLATGR